jgi:hypothetical protein
MEMRLDAESRRSLLTAGCGVLIGLAMIACVVIVGMLWE